MTEEVIAPKASFVDERMEFAVCPLGCGLTLRLVRPDDHPFGEFGFYQCDHCGAVVDICNMVDRPTEFNFVDTGEFRSVRSTLKEYGSFTGMPRGISAAERCAAREDAKLERLENQVRCENCNEKFDRAPSAKSRLTLDFCPKCRKLDSVRDKLAREEAKAKEAKAKAKSKTKKSAKRAGKTTTSRKKAK